MKDINGRYKLKQIGRLALRREGKFWNAYYALPDTMAGKLLLGSIAMCFVVDNKERMDEFREMMQQCVADIIEVKTGKRPTFPEGPQPAPEHEQGGHA